MNGSELLLFPFLPMNRHWGHLKSKETKANTARHVLAVLCFSVISFSQPASVDFAGIAPLLHINTGSRIGSKHVQFIANAAELKSALEEVGISTTNRRFEARAMFGN